MCQSFIPVSQILKFTLGPKAHAKALQCGEKYFYLGPWILNASIVNSSVNFIIYFVCARGFRRKLMKIFNYNNKISDVNVSETGNKESTDLKTNSSRLAH